MNKKSIVTCLAIIGGELFTGVTMLAGYQAWIQPGAPRNRAQQTKPEAAAPAPPAPTPTQVAVVTPPPVETPIAPAVAPAPVPAAPPPPLQKAAQPAKRPAAQLAQAKPAQAAPAASARQVTPVIAAQQAPAPIPSPTPRQLTPTAPTPAPASLTQRGITALNARDFAGAASLLRQARQAQPGNPDLGYLLGMALEGSGELGAAIDAFRSCTSGPYAQIARAHVKAAAKKLGK